MRLKMLFSILFFLSFVISTHAAEKVLCIISSDIDSDYAKMVVDMDSDNRSITHLYQDSYHDSKLTKRIELKASALKGGIILSQKDQYIIVRLHSDNFDPEAGGGVLYLDTLYSAISGERRQYEMDLAMGKSGPELSQKNQVFQKMNFIAKRSKVLGVIGIEKILFAN